MCVYYLDHNPVWDGCTFVCSRCGLEFIPKPNLEDVARQIGNIIGNNINTPNDKCSLSVNGGTCFKCGAKNVDAVGSNIHQCNK